LLTKSILLDRLETISTVARIGDPGGADVSLHQAGRGLRPRLQRQ